MFHLGLLLEMKFLQKTYALSVIYVKSRERRQENPFVV